MRRARSLVVGLLCAVIGGPTAIASGDGVHWPQMEFYGSRGVTGVSSRRGASVASFTDVSDSPARDRTAPTPTDVRSSTAGLPAARRGGAVSSSPRRDSASPSSRRGHTVSPSRHRSGAVSPSAASVFSLYGSRADASLNPAFASTTPYFAILSVGGTHTMHGLAAAPYGAGSAAFMSAYASVGRWSSGLSLRVNDPPTLTATSVDTLSFAYDASRLRAVVGTLRLSSGQRLTFAHGFASRSHGPAEAPPTHGWYLAARAPPKPMWGASVAWGALNRELSGFHATVFAARVIADEQPLPKPKRGAAAVPSPPEAAVQAQAQANNVFGSWTNGDWLDARSLVGMEGAYAWSPQTQIGAVGFIDGAGGGATGLHLSAGSERIAASTEISVTHRGAWAATAQATALSWDQLTARLDVHHISAGYENIHSRPRGVPVRRGRSPPASQGARGQLAFDLGPGTRLATAAQLEHVITRPRRGAAPWKLRLEEHLTQALGGGFVIRGGGRLASRPRGWNTRATADLSFEQPRWALGARATMDWGDKAYGWRDIGAHARAFSRERWQAHAQGGMRQNSKGGIEPFALALLRARVSDTWSITARYALLRAVHTVGGHVEVTL